MDEKTLTYMKNKIAEAEDIKHKIKYLTIFKELLSTGAIRILEVGNNKQYCYPGDTNRFSIRLTEALNRDYITELFREVLIMASEEEIARLEQEYNEL